MKELNLQPNSFLIRTISLFVAETFLAASILPAWAAPTDLLRPPIAATSGRAELVEAVTDGGRKGRIRLTGQDRRVRERIEELNATLIDLKNIKEEAGGDLLRLQGIQSEIESVQRNLEKLLRKRMRGLGGRKMARDGGEQTNATFEWGELGRLLAALAKQGPIDFRSVRKPGKGRQKVLVTYDPSEPKPLLKINGDRTATPEDYLGVLLAADLPPAMREAIVASARTSAPHLLAEAPDGGRRARDGGAKPAVYRIAPASSLPTPSRFGTTPVHYP